MKDKHTIDQNYILNLETGEIETSKEMSLDEWIEYSRSVYDKMKVLSRGSEQYKELRDEIGYCLLQLRTLCRARGTGYKKALKKIGILRKTANRWIRYVEPNI